MAVITFVRHGITDHNMEKKVICTCISTDENVHSHYTLFTTNPPTHYRKCYKRKNEGSRQNSSFRLRLTEIHPLPAEEEDFFRIGVK
jgi:hypothetical protein